MKVWEIISEKLADSFLFEMAFSRKEVESKITNESYQIIIHLIKILKWQDELNYQKHIGDVNSWLYKIQAYYIKGNKKPTQTDYYKWMFLDVAQNEKTISRYIKGLHKYHHLPVIRTDDEVFDSIKGILYQISYELPLDNFDDLTTYL